MPGWWSLDDIDATWVHDVLGIPDAVGWTCDQVTEGRVTATSRLRVTRGDGTVVTHIVKNVDPSWVGPLDPVVREHRFQRAVTDLGLPVALCRAERLDPATGTFWLVFDDVGPGSYGDDDAGLDFQNAFLAVASLATIHRAVPVDARRPPFLDPMVVPDRASLGADYVRFVQRYGELIDPVHLSVANQVVASIGTLVEHVSRLTSPVGIVHGDFRAGNLLRGIHSGSRPMVVTNWTHASWGPNVIDLASLLATALTPETRRALSDELIHRYCSLMDADADAGVARRRRGFDELRREIHDHAFMVLVQVIRNAVLAMRSGASDRTTSGDVWLRLFARVCTFLDDLSRPPTQTGSARVVTASDPSDEFIHPDGSGDGRSEEWTLSVADVAAGIGAWVRFGQHADLLGRTHLTASVTGPDIPSVSVSGIAQTTTDVMSLRTPSAWMHHRVIEPLRHVHLRLAARGASDLAESDVGVVIDLHWYSSARPAPFGLATTMLVPCAVAGTITLSGLGPHERRFTLDAPGYREHVWSATDWWDMRWTALTAHFEDGTDLRGVDTRIPGLPPVSLGSIRSPGSAPVLVDVCRVLSSPSDDDGGALIGAPGPAPWAFTVEPGSSTVTFTPVSDASVVRPDPSHAGGTLIRRAWGTFTRNDGRTGVGWVETELSRIADGERPRGLHDPSGTPPNL
ncbi:MAG: phosphotransferase [Gordonia paraffinivorans]